jgi:LytS/YehU family sensor histidine kinase
MLVQLADFLRFSLESNKQDKINLETELHNLDRYIAIEQIRFGNRLDFNKEIEPETLWQKLPAMILQPLVENAIKHGLGNSLDPLKLNLKATASDHFLLIQIENNFDSTALARKGAGHGIENVRKRLEGIYKNSAHFEISNSETVFRVQIKIPQ